MPLDLSDVWARCHPHLRPYAEHLAVSELEYARCPLCDGARALPLMARLRVGDGDLTAPTATILYCYGCERFSLPPRAWKYDSTHNAAVRAELERQGDGAQVTEVDARLWNVSPKLLCLEPTTRCNFSCWYCVGRQMKQEDIDLDGFHRVLENFPSIRLLYLVGEGEPLVHKHYFEMVRAAKERGLQVWMLSNGSVFTDGVIQKVCESGLDYVSVSIDSIDPERFAQSRVGGKLEEVWAGVERLARYRDANGFKNPAIGLRGTLFPHTHAELPAIQAEAKRRGFDFLDIFQPLNRMRTYMDIYPLGKKKLLDDPADVMMSIYQGNRAGILPPIWGDEARARFGDVVDELFGTTGRALTPRKSCDEKMIHARAAGDVIPCCQIKTVLSPAWNLRAHPAAEVFVDPLYETMRFNLFNGIFMSSCEGCYLT